MTHKGFTLIELLVVMAILGVLAGATVIVINPVELLAQSRDAERISDVESLSKSLSLYQVQNPGSMPGSTSTMYISVTDASSSCGDLGMPPLPAGWSYGCSSNPKRTDGTGWIPVSFSSLTSNSISALPVDPTNSTSTGLYYSYVTSGNNFEVTSLLESAKYRQKEASNPSIQDYPGVLAGGTDLSISPIFSPSGLTGYWNLDEATGTTAGDLSGNGDSGTLSGSTKPVWTTGQIGSALSFNGSTSYVSTPGPSIAAASPFTVSAWANLQSGAGLYPMIADDGDQNKGFLFGVNIGSNSAKGFNIYLRGMQTANNTPPAIGTWYNVVVVYDVSKVYVYVDGTLQSQASGGSGSLGFNGLYIGNGTEFGNSFWKGSIDDVRVYNRALSVSEIQALYNSTR